MQASPNSRILREIKVKKVDGYVRFQTGCLNMAVYIVIVDSSMGQIPRSMEHIIFCQISLYTVIIMLILLK